MKTSLLLTLMICALMARAQTIKIEYDYDAAGNRITRTYTVVTINNKSSEDTTSEAPVVSMLENMEIKLFPNPTQGKMILEISNLPEGAAGELVVTDLQGRVLMNIETISAYMELDFTAYSAGTYNVVLNVNEKKQYWAIIRE